MKKERKNQSFVHQTFTEHLLCFRHGTQACETEGAAQEHRWLKDCFKEGRHDSFTPGLWEGERGRVPEARPEE